MSPRQSPFRLATLLRPAVFAVVVLLGASGPVAAAQSEGPIVITPASSGPIVPTFLAPKEKTHARLDGFVRGTVVDFATRMDRGTVVVRTKERALYLVIGDGKAVRYPVAVAKKGFGWSGIERVSLKQRWPDWRPPDAMRKRRPELPAFMEGGPGNPLGARAIYLGDSIYRIHGTNEPLSIGKAASSGCIRMLNEDVSELYQHVDLGAVVVVM